MELKDCSDVLTVSELQAVLRIGKNKTYELLKTNKIKVIRCGKGYIIPKSAVLTFLDTPTHNTNSESE